MFDWLTTEAGEQAKLIKRLHIARKVLFGRQNVSDAAKIPEHKNRKNEKEEWNVIYVFAQWNKIKFSLRSHKRIFLCFYDCWIFKHIKPSKRLRQKFLFLYIFFFSVWEWKLKAFIYFTFRIRMEWTHIKLN